MLFPWTRNRVLVFATLLALSVISYLSFDNYIRPIYKVIPLPDEVSIVPGNATQSPSPTPAHNSTSVGADPRILLVSAFFPLSKSKHSMRDYRAWLSNYLSRIRTPIYLFVPPTFESLARELRGSLPLTLNTSYTSPFDIPPLQGREDAYEAMHALDREKARHTPELYAIWAGKPFFVAEGLINAGGEAKYDYAFWVDAGSFRETHAYAAWPDLGRVEEVWKEGAAKSGTRTEELLFFPMYDPPHGSMQFWTENMGPVDNEFSEGSFFGGSPQTIAWWRHLYYAYHDAYLSKSIFVGKDQTLINALLLLFPARILTVHPRATLDTRPCGSEWYYYEYWLASAGERAAMAARWDRWRWAWDVRWWMGERDACGVAPVKSMKDVLREAFGMGWRPPPATIGA